MLKNPKVTLIIIVALLVLISGAFAYREYYNFKKIEQIQKTADENINKLNSLLAEKQKIADEISATLNDTQKTLEEKESDLSNLSDEMNDLNKDYEKLEKIVETDKELLAKYSKIYFLNENYSPKKVVPLDTQYKISANKEILIHSEVRGYLEDMIDDAQMTVWKLE